MGKCKKAVRLIDWFHFTSFFLPFLDFLSQCREIELIGSIYVQFNNNSLHIEDQHFKKLIEKIIYKAEFNACYEKTSYK